MRLQPILPSWLLVTVLLIAIIGAVFWFWRHKGKKLTVPTRWVRRGAIIILLFVIATGPSVAIGSTSPGVKNLDVILLVDTTGSMGAEDYNGSSTRLDGAKQDLISLGNQLAGARFTIIKFDATATILLPATTDLKTYQTAVSGMQRELYRKAQGSSIDQPRKLAIEQLKQSRSAYPDRKRVLFYFGDGEQTVDRQPDSFKDLARFTSGGAVFGYGTEKGAKMRQFAGASATTQQYITTPDPATKSLIPAISKLDQDNLRDIAKQIKVPYIYRSGKQSFAEAYTASAVDDQIRASKNVKTFVNLYWLFAVPLVVLLILDGMLIAKEASRLLKARKERDD